MKRGSTIILKGVVILIGLAVLALCALIFFVAVISNQADYYRPILIGMYLPAIPFFIALYQAFKLLNYIDSNSAFSELSVKTLEKIKYCAITISALFVLGMPYIIYAADRDDAPGVVLIGLVIVCASFVIAAFAGVLQKLLGNAIDIKSENELTV